MAIYIGDCRIVIIHSKNPNQPRLRVLNIFNLQFLWPQPAVQGFQIVIHTDGGAGPPNFSV